MARTKDKEKAIALRGKGLSYSQIKNELGISKSTLSGWLKDMPLSPERLKQLKNTDVQIEKTRATKLKTKLARRQKVYESIAQDIQSSKDMQFVSGFYLYWGEGTKTSEYTIALTNSDPAIINCFVVWLDILGVSRDDLRIKLHLYNDQNENELKKFWSHVTGISKSQYYKTYVKESHADRKTYKGMFPYGTCAVMYHNRDVYEYVLEGIRYLRDVYRIADRE